MQALPRNTSVTDGCRLHASYVVSTEGLVLGSRPVKVIVKVAPGSRGVHFRKTPSSLPNPFLDKLPTAGNPGSIPARQV